MILQTVHLFQTKTPRKHNRYGAYNEAVFQW